MPDGRVEECYTFLYIHTIDYVAVNIALVIRRHHRQYAGHVGTEEESGNIAIGLNLRTLANAITGYMESQIDRSGALARQMAKLESVELKI